MTDTHCSKAQFLQLPRQSLTGRNGPRVTSPWAPSPLPATGANARLPVPTATLRLVAGPALTVARCRAVSLRPRALPRVPAAVARRRRRRRRQRSRTRQQQRHRRGQHDQSALHRRHPFSPHVDTTGGVLPTLRQIAGLPRRVAAGTLILWRVVALTVAGAGTERRVRRRGTRHDTKRQQRGDQHRNETFPHDYPSHHGRAVPDPARPHAEFVQGLSHSWLPGRPGVKGYVVNPRRTSNKPNAAIVRTQRRKVIRARRVQAGAPPDRG